MAESHASMRDDFEITVPQIDTLVEIVKATIGDKGGVRMTGGGFGGCVVALVPEELVPAVQDAVAKQYEAKTGIKRNFLCLQSITRSRTVLNETPTLAPDGLPYRLLTLRNSAGMSGYADGLGRNVTFCPRTDA